MSMLEPCRTCKTLCSKDDENSLYNRVSFISFVALFTFLMQLASGAFGHIKDTVLSALNREPTMDISPETVGTLSLIMLAQAQEVFFLKATSGTKHRSPIPPNRANNPQSPL